MLTYVFCFFIGAVLGFLASEFADRWGCSQRYRSSWQKKWGIVLASGIAAALLYHWEVEMQMLARFSCCPINLREIPALYVIFVQIYIMHLILFVFLLAATLTDFYEMIIPDSITVVGTVLALFTAMLFPQAALPVTEMYWIDDSLLTVPDTIIGMHLWSPISAGTSSLLTMTLLWWFWCFAMLDRVWYTKLPFRKASAIFCRYLYRSSRTKCLFYAALIAPLFFAVAAHSDSEQAVFSALVGMATGMVLIWSVRLVSRWILGIEAMGFGDVTLMGMIGAFLGWQAVLVVFFAAPFFGLVYGIVNVALGKGRAVPYGPFLCLATVFVVIFWRYVWEATAEYFAFGIGFIGLFLLVMLVLFGGLLHIVHQIFSRRRT